MFAQCEGTMCTNFIFLFIRIAVDLIYAIVIIINKNESIIDLIQVLNLPVSSMNSKCYPTAINLRLKS